ncbi:DUF3040 domain-containing protein [Streptomyces pratensis]|uniref:DUF3040 domain-containing protein n=1 Tax=Streptomyces pratensis TaxID=1169025 RepID=UPI003018EFC0
MCTYDERLRHLEKRLCHDDPWFAEAMAGSAAREPRAYHRRTAWLWLAAGSAALGAGIAMAHGLLIATGLVVCGAAAQLFDPRRRRRRDRKTPGGR